VFRVHGSEFSVQGSRLRVQGSEFSVQGSRFRVKGSGFTVKGSGFKCVSECMDGPVGSPRISYLHSLLKRFIGNKSVLIFTCASIIGYSY
jgi:hypothetical protein